MSNWYEEVANLIGKLSTPDSFYKGKDKKNTAALGVTGASAKFRAEQMQNRKAADLAREATPEAPPANEALATRAPSTGGGNLGLSEPTGNTQVAQRGGELAQKGGDVIQGGRVPASAMRNVTPQAGAGIEAVASGGAVLIPVGATLAALLASSGQLGVGDQERSLVQPYITDQMRESAGGGEEFVNRFKDQLARDKAIAPFMKAADTPVGTLVAPEFSMRPATAPVEPVAAPKPSLFENAPKAIPVAESSEDKLRTLFAHTHGTPFDPNSSMDRKKMEVIRQLALQEGSDKLTPNQFALKIYGRK